jgi:hypothetical protein
LPVRIADWIDDVPERLAAARKTALNAGTRIAPPSER